METRKLIILIVAVVVLLFAIAFCIYWFWYRKRTKQPQPIAGGSTKPISTDTINVPDWKQQLTFTFCNESAPLWKSTAINNADIDKSMFQQAAPMEDTYEEDKNEPENVEHDKLNGPLYTSSSDDEIF